MTRFATQRRVFYVEEAVADAGPSRLHVEHDGEVRIVRPHLLRSQLSHRQRARRQLRQLIDQLVHDEAIGGPGGSFAAWYYTPMALSFTMHLAPEVVAYDCMDQLSAFKGAAVDLGVREAELLARADLVFTGGRSLYEAKRSLHGRVFCFPSSVDVAHFARARVPLSEPADQAPIARPRLGYAGVIDERLDLPLLAGLAKAQPDWQLVLLGPVVKIDPGILPRAPNIHYLGMKPYGELPFYLAGWDVALLPFARNEATRFISPTKTPEYLAAGRPVVSTSIADVVQPYGALGLAAISDTVEGWLAAVDRCLTMEMGPYRERADELLAETSWDQTATSMGSLLEAARRKPRWAEERGVAV